MITGPQNKSRFILVYYIKLLYTFIIDCEVSMKITNELLDQYFELELKAQFLIEKLRQINLEMEPIKILLKERGSCSTKDYVVLVEDRERKAYWVKETKYQIVKVSRKAA